MKLFDKKEKKDIKKVVKPQEKEEKSTNKELTLDQMDTVTGGAGLGIASVGKRPMK